MDLSDNPYRMVCGALQDMLEASDAFVTEFDTGNRIWYGGTTYRYDKDSFAGADMPSVQLILAEHDIHLQATNTDNLDIFTWEIQILTGDVRFLTVLDAIWAIKRAMLGWETNLMDSLTWNGKKFVHLCRPLKVVEELDYRFQGRTNAPLSPGNRGWVAIWRGEVQMHFTVADVRE